MKADKTKNALELANAFEAFLISRRRPDPYTAERARMAEMSTNQVRKLWDAYDGCNSPLGFSGEAIHMELNMRGDGDYCAV